MGRIVQYFRGKFNTHLFIILVMLLSTLTVYGETGVGGVGKISENRVSLRSQPGPRAEVIADVKKVQEVVVDARSDDRFYVEGKYNYWYRVETPDGGSGWIFGENLSLSKPLEETIEKDLKTASEDTLQGMSVEIVPVSRQDIKVSISALGTVGYRSRAVVKPKVGGKVESIRVEEGGLIKKGDIIAIIEHDQFEIELKQREIDLISVQAAAAGAEVRLKKTELALQKALANTQVELEIAKTNLKKLVTGPRFQEIEKAQALLRERKAALTNLEKTLKNKEELFKIGAITEEELNSVKAQHSSAEAQYELAQKDLELLVAGFREEDVKLAELGVQSAQISLDMAEEADTKIEEVELELARARVKRAQVDVELAKHFLESTTVRAPISGMVAVRNVEEGERLGPDDTIVTLLNIDSVYVQVAVDERRISHVPIGGKSEITSDAYGVEKFIGKTHLISPIVDEKTRTSEVKIEVENSDHRLRPGMFARAQITIKDRKDVLAIPREALLQRGDRRVVFVVNSGLAFEQEVEVGLETEELVEIISGLDEDDAIIVSGHWGLEDKTPVAVRLAAAL